MAGRLCRGIQAEGDSDDGVDSNGKSWTQLAMQDGDLGPWDPMQALPDHPASGEEAFAANSAAYPATQRQTYYIEGLGHDRPISDTADTSSQEHDQARTDFEPRVGHDESEHDARSNDSIFNPARTYHGGMPDFHLQHDEKGSCSSLWPNTAVLSLDGNVRGNVQTPALPDPTLLEHLDTADDGTCKDFRGNLNEMQRMRLVAATAFSAPLTMVRKVLRHHLDSQKYKINSTFRLSHKCLICGIQFKHIRKDLLEHIASHLERPHISHLGYKCPNCAVVFLFAKDFSCHLREQNNSNGKLTDQDGGGDWLADATGNDLEHDLHMWQTLQIQLYKGDVEAAIVRRKDGIRPSQRARTQWDEGAHSTTRSYRSGPARLESQPRAVTTQHEHPDNGGLLQRYHPFSSRLSTLLTKCDIKTIDAPQIYCRTCSVLTLSLQWLKDIDDSSIEDVFSALEQRAACPATCVRELFEDALVATSPSFHVALFHKVAGSASLLAETRLSLLKEALRVVRLHSWERSQLALIRLIASIDPCCTLMVDCLFGRDGAAIDMLRDALDSGCDANARSTDGSPMLVLAIRSRSLDTVRLLMGYGALADAVDSKACNSIHTLVDTFRTRSEEIACQMFLYYLLGGVADGSQVPDAILAHNEQGYTPLTLACHDRNFMMLRALLARGARAGLHDRWSLTGLQHVCTMDHEQAGETVEALLYHGADLDRPDTRGNTLLHYTCGPIYSALTRDTIRPLLLGAELSVDRANMAGTTPLMLAVRSSTTATAALLQSGALVDLRDNEGNTALHHACMGWLGSHSHPSQITYTNGQRQQQQLVSSSGSKYDTVALPSKNPAQINAANVLDLLLNAGADFNIRNHSGITALMLATVGENQDTVGTLIAAGSAVIPLESLGPTTADHRRVALGTGSSHVTWTSEGSNTDTPEPLHVSDLRIPILPTRV
ncbi:hypothetical protein LTR86_008643 [Recurvomyces mirabilis]|nr:hypothetical protein LTR86_008643 [Recurvomyces mirabilis]